MLDSLFNPGAIAVIGASADPKKVGHAVLNNLIRFKFMGALYPVNPSCSEILGLKAYAKVSDIGQPIDLAIIVIPAKFVPDSLRECAAAGIKSAIVISAGFKEAGAGGTLLEEELKQISKEQHIRILGPNCLGLINTANDHERHLCRGHAAERHDRLLLPVRRHGHRDHGLGHRERCRVLEVHQPREQGGPVGDRLHRLFHERS